MLKLLNRLTIVQKLNISFGILLVMVIAMLGLNIVMQNKIGILFDEFKLVTAEGRLVNTLMDNYVHAVINAQRYRMMPDAKSKDAVITSIKKLEDIENKALEDFKDPDFHAELKHASHDTHAYLEGFMHASKANAALSQYMDEFNAHGPATRKLVSDIMQDKRNMERPAVIEKSGLHIQHLLLSRYYIRNFVMTGDADSYQRAIKEAKTAEQALGQLQRQLNTASVRKAVESFKKYMAVLEPIHTFYLEKERIYREEIDVYGPKILEDYEHLNETLTEEQEVMAKDAKEMRTLIGTISMATSVVAIILTVLLAFLIGRLIRVGLRSTTSQMLRLAGGDLTFSIEGSERRDEIGEMSRALETFQENGLERERLEAEQKEAQKAQLQRAEEVSDAVAEFEKAIADISAKLNDSAQGLQVMSSQLSSAMEKTDAQSSSVAAAALEASTNVQTVASAAEEMAMSVQEISRNVSDTANTARSCSGAAENSQQKLDTLQNAVNDIGAIIESINDVAEQTNLLALNATIEAARAGDAGKGFAVVANEVKSLASQTHKMTEEISGKVGEIQNSASETITAVNDILEQIQSVNDQTNSVASAVEEQNVTTTEISRNVQEAANGTSEVSENIQSIQQAANESAQSTKELEGSAKELANQAAVLRESVDSFLNAVKD